MQLQSFLASGFTVIIPMTTNQRFDSSSLGHHYLPGGAPPSKRLQRSVNSNCSMLIPWILSLPHTKCLCACVCVCSILWCKWGGDYPEANLDKFFYGNYERKKNSCMFLATVLEPCIEIWRFLIKKSLNLQQKKFQKCGLPISTFWKWLQNQKEIDLSVSALCSNLDFCSWSL